MTVSLKSLGIDRLNVEDGLALVTEILESIATDSEELPLSQELRDELDRRIAAHDASPESAIAWTQIKAAALEHLKRECWRSFFTRRLGGVGIGIQAN